MDPSWRQIMELQIRDFLSILAVIVAAFGTWYKIHFDLDKRIKDAEDKMSAKLSGLYKEFVRRDDYDRDIREMKEEIKGLRTDIQQTNVNISHRIDLLFQRLGPTGA
jgi:hypothetical protein